MSASTLAVGHLKSSQPRTMSKNGLKKSCVFICTHTYMYIHMHAYLCIYAHAYMDIYAYIWVHIHIYPRNVSFISKVEPQICNNIMYIIL